ncbi:MAG: M28 family peptidase [Planctomycetes bacterium]|nr:M28 family peptidase [Planctomycetota bacterium]
MLAMATTKDVKRHMDVLTRDIGTRLAGSPEEFAAAKYVTTKFKEYGLTNIKQETFPCASWTCKTVSFAVRAGRKWRSLDCIPLAHSKCTKGTVEAELVYLETASERDLRGKDLKGKIGLIFGGFGDQPDKYVALLKSGMVALVMVDSRLPFTWPVAMGMSRYWKRLGRQTGISIAYFDAWDIVKKGLNRARIKIDVQVRNTKSPNAIGEVKGSGSEVITITAHHDSVYGNVGAEDDGSGTITVLELARIFADAKPRRTLRFITVGTEEQLSEGSKHYVLAHKKEMKKIVFNLNTDSIGSWMGQNECFVAGGKDLEKYANKVMDDTGFNAEVKRDISPFSDQFPFNMFGVPSLWFHRSNCPGGRWYHHSKHDVPSSLSNDIIARTINTQAAILNDLAHRKKLPFKRSIPADQMKLVKTYKRDLYGLK